MHQMYTKLPNYLEMCKKMDNNRIPIWHTGLDREEGRQLKINSGFQLNRSTINEVFCLCQILERKHGITLEQYVSYKTSTHPVLQTGRKFSICMELMKLNNLLKFQLSVIQTETYRLTHPIFKCIKYDQYNLQETPVCVPLSWCN